MGKRWSLPTTLVLLLLFWGRVWVNIRDQSPVVDEPVHLARGAAYWRTGDLRLQHGHPPLTHALNGLFLLLEPDLPSPADLPGWSQADRIVVAHHLLWDPGRPVERILILGRWSSSALGILLALLVLRWVTEQFGRSTGVIALLLITFDPNVLAHAALATTDLPVTCMIFATSYTFSRWLSQPSYRRATMTGILLGLAWGAKLSALFLLLPLGLTIGWHLRHKRGKDRRYISSLALMLLFAALTLWVVYRFEVGTWGGVPVPMPTHWKNIRYLWRHQQRGHLAFFLGELSWEGWWYYFPALVCIKTPLPLLLLLPIAAFVVRRQPRFLLPSVTVFIPTIYLLLSIPARINIGYRHILPILPYLAMWAAVPFASRPSSRLTVLLAGLLIWFVAASLWIHPHYLAYFNEIVGGPRNGYRYAVDSNLDWGQDLGRLARYAQTRGIPPEDIWLAYFGSADPRYYLPGIRLLDTSPFEHPDTAFHPFNPTPGVYAISASLLQGLLLDDPDVFDSFRRRTPTATVGYSIFVYTVEPDPFPPTWVAVCRAPAPPLDSSGLRIGFGQENLRYVAFDCRRGWVYPGGTGPGWYLLPDEREISMPAGQFLSSNRIVFKGRAVRSRPALAVYRWDETNEPLDRLALLQAEEGIDFGQTALFLGSTIHPEEARPGESVVLTTYWRALSQPEHPLSVMAHLVDGDGNLVAQDDGMSLPMEYWAPGDVFVQIHRFDLPPDLPPGFYTPRIGLYALDSMERLPVAQGTDNALYLAPIQVVAP